MVGKFSEVTGSVIQCWQPILLCQECSLHRKQHKTPNRKLQETPNLLAQQPHLFRDQLRQQAECRWPSKWNKRFKSNFFTCFFKKPADKNCFPSSFSNVSLSLFLWLKTFVHSFIPYVNCIHFASCAHAAVQGIPLNLREQKMSNFSHK